MRNRFRAFTSLPLFHGVVQEEVNQDRIDSRFGMLTQDLTTDQLHRPNAAATELYFPRVTALNRHPLPDVAVQRWAVLQTAEGIEHLWYPIVWLLSAKIRCRQCLWGCTSEHRDAIDIMESAIACAFETSPQVCYEDLGPLVEADCLAFESRFVPKVWEVVYQQIHESGCGPIGFFNAGDEAPMEFLFCVSNPWCREDDSIYISEYPPGFSDAGDAFFQQRHLLRSSGPEDMPELFVCAFIFVDPVGRTCDLDTCRKSAPSNVS